MFVCTQPPIERVLGSAFINRGGMHTEVQDKCYDVPLLSTLQQLLKTETVSKEVCSPEPCGIFNYHSFLNRC